MINTLAFGSYNNRFPKEEGENAWLTRDLPTVAGRATDPFTSFKFTVSGYMDLFRALERSNNRAWYAAYPKEMPTLVISGDMDPVGDYGKGPDEVYRKLLRQGASHVKLKIYEGARHELFNETNRQEVFEYLGCWLGGVIK